jgi:hypothetical protein
MFSRGNQQAAGEKKTIDDFQIDTCSVLDNVEITNLLLENQIYFFGSALMVEYTINWFGNVHVYVHVQHHEGNLDDGKKIGLSDRNIFHSEMGKLSYTGTIALPLELKKLKPIWGYRLAGGLFHTLFWSSLEILVFKIK